ncbi:MAG TPA: hypothetical protein VHV77_15655 [Pirellulales bacterium]|jgi:hypothetical protein|nr:hypothetical protein [Pirellulales bacterium]
MHVTTKSSWLILVAIVAAWALAQWLLPHREFRSCAGGICDAINRTTDATPDETMP